MMIKSKFCLIIISILLVLTSVGGCSPMNNEKVKPQESIQDFKQYFELKLYSDKSDYSANEKINIWAVLKYIGDQGQIEIWHQNPYISFIITDGKNISTGEVFDATLHKTVLEKDKFYWFDYQKTGLYLPDAPDAEYWKKFYEEKDLYLPKGQYTIQVRGVFSLTQYGDDQNNNLNDEIKITVA